MSMFLIVCVCVLVHTHVCAFVCYHVFLIGSVEARGKFVAVNFSFHHVGLKDGTPVDRFGGRPMCLLTHLTGDCIKIHKNIKKHSLVRNKKFLEQTVTKILQLHMRWKQYFNWYSKQI